MEQTLSQSALNTHLDFLFNLVKDRAESLRKSISTVTDSYARAWNLGFATNIVLSLPQELKDMIYIELMHLESPNGNREVLRTSASYPHYFQSNYMGTEFVTELSEQFHKDKHFTLQHPRELEGFLSNDRFGMMCVPAKYVRFINIELSLKLFHATSGNCRDWSSPKFHTPLKQHFVAALRGLDALKQLAKKNPGVQHTLGLRVSCETRSHGPKFAEVLVPLVYDLKDQGWNVKIDGRYAHRQPHAQLTATDFDYNKTRAEWTQKIRINSAFVTDDPAGVTKSSRRRWTTYST